MEAFFIMNRKGYQVTINMAYKGSGKVFVRSHLSTAGPDTGRLFFVEPTPAFFVV